MMFELNLNDNGAGQTLCRTEGKRTMKLWLRSGLLALCVAALMTTSTLADGTYSLKVSEINGTPIALGSACCSGRLDAVCTPNVVGIPCEFNNECTDPTKPACKPVVCDIAVPAHCPIGNSSCQLFATGNFCTLPTELNIGDVVPGDIIRVDAFLKQWDVLPNSGFCLATSDAGLSCTIVPNSCTNKTVCTDTGSDCNATLGCVNNFCLGTNNAISCIDQTDCADIQCISGQCIPNTCSPTPLLTSFQWGFDLDSLTSGDAGSIDLAALPCTLDDDCRYGETIATLCTCAAATCQMDQTCTNEATAFLQQSRPDYMFATQLGGFALVANNGLILEYSHSFFDVIPVLDVGDETYIGTMIVSPSMGAAGDFTLGFTPSSITNSFLNEISALIPVTDRRPLVIRMPPAQDCNNNLIPDADDIANCPMNVPFCQDCNSNMTPDECDISNGEPDTNNNNIPDICEPNCTTPIVQSWTSIGQHGVGCIFNPSCGGLEYGQDMPAGSDYSEARSTGINKIVVKYDIDVDVTNATVMVDGCDVDGFIQNTAGITMSVVAGANLDEAVILFSPSLPGNNPQIGETPVVYDITLDGVECLGGGMTAPIETRVAWAIFGDANASPITVNNGDLGFVRQARDIILGRPAGMQVIDPLGPTGVFEIRADINNDNTVSNTDLGLVRLARDSVQQPSGMCP